MKPIQLSEEQKNKLLEMCQVLFPEYEFNDWALRGRYGSLRYGLKNCEEWDFIHWFEFCLTHLIDRVAKPFEDVNRENYEWIRDDLYQSLYRKGIHPVDSIYQRFKSKI